MNYPAYYPQFPATFAPQTAYQPPRTDPAQGYTVGQPMPQTQPAAQSIGFSTRPVTSREEALGVQVDFFGPGTLMPDLGHGKIYLKKFNQNTGASDLFVFALEADRPAEDPQVAQYVTRQELDGMRAKLDQLSSIVEQFRGFGKGDE